MRRSAPGTPSTETPAKSDGYWRNPPALVSAVRALLPERIV